MTPHGPLWEADAGSCLCERRGFGHRSGRWPQLCNTRVHPGPARWAVLAARDVPPAPFTVRPAPDDKDGCRAMCREFRGASCTWDRCPAVWAWSLGEELLPWRTGAAAELAAVKRLPRDPTCRLHGRDGAYKLLGSVTPSRVPSPRDPQRRPLSSLCHTDGSGQVISSASRTVAGRCWDQSPPGDILDAVLSSRPS